MASTSGGVCADDVHTSQVSYQRTGSSTRIISAIPEEHLQTVRSGIQSDWDNVKPVQASWVNRNDSTNANYTGSVVGLRITRKLKRGVGFHDTRRADVWRAAAVEFTATAGLIFLSIAAFQHVSADSAAVRAFLQALIYSFVILAAAPISGGHLNPAITLTTFLTGHATLVRSLLYIVAQLSGGILGATAVRFLTTPEVRMKFSMGACLFQELPAEGVAVTAVDTVLSKGQGLLAEMVLTIIMLFVVYGVGFDTRSIVVTCPITSPFIIGGVFGILIFISQGLGYTAAMNPARCLGPALIYRHDLWQPLCIFTIGQVGAAVIVAVFQLLVNQGNGEVCEPVLPLNFFQTVTPDHLRPGFGPRSSSVFYPTNLDQDTAHSQQLLPNIPASNSSELQTPSEPTSGSKYSLILQIKAFMKPKESEGRRVGTTTIVDAADQNLILQQYANSRASSDDSIHHIGDPEKDR